MSDPRQPLRGEAPRPPTGAHGEPASRKSFSHTPTQVPVLSIETPTPTPNHDPSQRHSSSSTSQTPHSPAHTPLFRVPQSPRGAPGSGELSQKLAKVAIPRLKRSVDALGDDASRSGGRHRVNHACEPCRHRKTKCSGERPVCRHCQDFKITCFYADGKRDRVKK